MQRAGSQRERTDTARPAGTRARRGLCIVLVVVCSVLTASGPSEADWILEQAVAYERQQRAFRAAQTALQVTVTVRPRDTRATAGCEPWVGMLDARRLLQVRLPSPVVQRMIARVGDPLSADAYHAWRMRDGAAAASVVTHDGGVTTVRTEAATGPVRRAALFLRANRPIGLRLDGDCVVEIRVVEGGPGAPPRLRP